MLHVFQTYRWNDQDLLNIARVVHQLDLHRRHLLAQVSQEDDPAGTKEEKAISGHFLSELRFNKTWDTKIASCR